MIIFDTAWFTYDEHPPTNSDDDNDSHVLILSFEQKKLGKHIHISLMVLTFWHVFSLYLQSHSFFEIIRTYWFKYGSDFLYMRGRPLGCFLSVLFFVVSSSFPSFVRRLCLCLVCLLVFNTCIYLNIFH